MSFPREADVPRYYGAVGTNQVKIAVPAGYPMVYAWNGNPPIRQISCHEKVAPSLSRILAKTYEAYGPGLADLGLHLFGGSLNVRRKRGGTSWSMHSWGIAMDYDPDHNQLRWASKPNRYGGPARFAQKVYEPFFRIVEGEGWVSLGRARNFDWMHIQAATL